MKTIRKPARAFMLLAGCTLLAGCSTTDKGWLDALTRIGMGEQEQGAPPPAYVPTRARITDKTDFCQGVARQAGHSQGFDAPTSQRVYQVRLSQCESLMADGSGVSAQP